MKKIILTVLVCVALMLSLAGCAGDPTTAVFTVNPRTTVTPVPTPQSITVLTAENGWNYAIQNGSMYIYGYSGTEKEIKLPTKGATVTYNDGTIKTYAFYENEMDDELNSSEVKSKTMYDVAAIDELGISYLSKVKLDDSQYHCELDKLYIPKEYSTVPTGFFAFSDKAIDVQFDAEVDLVYDGNVLYNKDKTILYLCNDKKIKSFNIPSTVKTIAAGAFRNCSELTSITIPSNVERVCDYAFYNCRSLKTVTVDEGVKYIANQSFNRCSNLEMITLAKSVITVGVGAIQFHDGLSIYIYKDSLLDEYFHSDDVINTAGAASTFADYVKYIQ